jgi:hypothetical protein
MERGVGPGLSPDPWTHCITYDPTYIMARMLGAHCIALHCIAMYCNILHIYIYIYNRVLNVGAGFETQTRVLSVGAGPKRKLHGFQTV